MNKKIQEIVKKNIDWVTEKRHYLHQNPELSECEYNTQKYIIDFLDSYDIAYEVLANTGIYAKIENGKGKKLAFRADMDALPLEESSKLEYKSKNMGVMHACGHDVHMAVQMGLIKSLKENLDLWNGSAYFFFQPAEETIGGAKRMLDEGANKDKINNLLSFHSASEISVGKIGIRYGKLHATSMVFKLNIIGKECHGALAFNGIDSIVIGAKVVDYMQQIVSRKIDARDCAVITIGTFNAGTKENIVAGSAVLTGTVRTMTQETKQYILNIFNTDLVKFVESFGAKLEIEIHDSYAPVINDKEFTDFLYNNACDILGSENVELIEMPRMDVEDVGFFLEEIKGSFYRLGVSSKGKFTELHTKDFLVDDRSLKVGLMVQLKVALEYLC